MTGNEEKNEKMKKMKEKRKKNGKISLKDAFPSESPDLLNHIRCPVFQSERGLR